MEEDEEENKEVEMVDEYVPKSLSLEELEIIFKNVEFKER